MFQQWVVLLISFAYLGILFSVAYYADKRADAGRSIISNPYVYTLSIAVYCTAWTFYGSVGRAAETGVGFLPIYLGPTLMASTWWFVLRKMIRISKVHRITSIADFISSRYRKSALIGGLVTIIAVVGIMPYISLQLKAVSISLNVLHSFPNIEYMEAFEAQSFWHDTSFYVTLVLAAFAIVFGTRHIDVTERHEGMVAAIAFESVVKILAFCAVGIFITYKLFSGAQVLFSGVIDYDNLLELIKFDSFKNGYINWLSLTFLSMMAILFLPRQFQVLVVENVNEDHIRKAAWLFPCYLLLINLFVLPIAFAGLMLFPNGNIDPDTFILAIPLSEGRELLALFVFLGGLSAATGMIIVATVSLSTMVCNDLVMPVLLRIKTFHEEDLSGTLLLIRRGSILALLMMGFLYFRLIGESYTLVTIGLVSFTAAAQFAPPILIGIYWKQACRNGAIAGLLAGFLMWTYTLLLPSFAKSGWLPLSFLVNGPFGIELLRPYQLFGLNIFDPISHAVFWSMLVNVSFLVLTSMFTNQDDLERLQASAFVDVFRLEGKDDGSFSLIGTAKVSDLKGVLSRFIGTSRTEIAFTAYSKKMKIVLKPDKEADSNLVKFTERELSGAIGSASARVMMSSVVKGEVTLEGVLEILDEASHVLEYSHMLEQKSSELEEATKELKNANIRLQELDRLKDEFVNTVSHELRTPLTSIRAFLEILFDNPEMDEKQRHKFLGITVKETERLTRLVNQVLDLAKIESGKAEWQLANVEMADVVRDALIATSQLFIDNDVALDKEVEKAKLTVNGDRDRLIQVIINLLSNAVKFSKAKGRKVKIIVNKVNACIVVKVIDNGIGIPKEEQESIFEKFHQINTPDHDKPGGSGLGLTICKKIIDFHSGTIAVVSSQGEGATFSISLPEVKKT